MPRRARSILGGYVYHVLKDADFEAFEQVVVEAQERLPLRILGYTLMSNHWHFVVWPRRGQHQQVSDFFRWLTVTHSQRWHAHHGTAGMGHVYQGRFKSFPIAEDEHLLTVLRYVERNPLRAGLVARAEEWRFGSLYVRTQGTVDQKQLLTDSPIPLARSWVDQVNRPQTEAELAALRSSVVRGRPFGGAAWSTKVGRQLGLEHTFRSRGRPRKAGVRDGSEAVQE
jgi:putative transposase